nr:S8 family serine peptidase [Cytobacillus depressus]
MVLSLLSPFQASANEQGTNSFKPNGQSESNMKLKAAVLEQLNLSDGLPKLHKELQDLSGDEEVAVIVHLSEDPVALEKGISQLKGKKLTSSQEKAITDKVNQQQVTVNKEMVSKGISFKKGYSFNTVLNGFAAKVKADDLDKLLKVKGVTLVEPDVTVYALQDSKTPNNTLELEKIDKVEASMNTSISFLGIEKLWKEGYEGQGIKVAVLDTGIDTKHPEFATNLKGGKNFVPHGNDYARPRADDDPSETSPLDRPAHRPKFDASGRSFYTDHGTHVAGTIAAIGANEYGIKGIAPKVDLYAYRVLGAYGSGENSGIIAAIDTAVKEKMDVINLSLGGGSNTETDAGSFAINNAMMAGTISVIATGNSGPNRGTMGIPATARLGIGVGNTTNPETSYNGKVHVKAGDYEYSKQLNLMGTTFGQDLAAQLNGEFELVAVPKVGEATDYNGIDVKGKVALISRGEIAFVDKIAFAKSNGAIAAIIHNFDGGTNAPNESGIFLGDGFTFIPTFDMSVTDGAAIREALQNGSGTISFSDFDSSRTLGDEVSDSSSRGPSTPNFDIKPDVTAPGTDIMSSVPAYGADFPDADYSQSYDRFTGTSMATPHIAGIAALVKQANPDWTPFDVKVALSNTAKLLNTKKYDVFSQGAGRVDAYAAAHPRVLAYALDTANNDREVVENLKGTVTFGHQKLDKDISVTKQILVKDLKGKGGEFNVTVDMTKSFGDAKIVIDKPTFTLDGEQLINVTLTASKNANAKPSAEALGYIHISTGENDNTVTSLSVNETDIALTTDDTKQLKVTEEETVIEGDYLDISLPFAAELGGEAPVEIRNFQITETDLSFNGDGIKDSALLTFTVTGDLDTNYIEIWDIMNPEGGAYEDGYIGYLHAGSSLAAGSYKLPITGLYRSWEKQDPPQEIPDGLYTIDMSALTKSGNPRMVEAWVGPIVVKKTKPEIAATFEKENLTGNITDKYLDYNDELAQYGLDYNINEKLHASYVLTTDDDTGEERPFQLEQDGSFELELGALTENDTVKVVVVDAAGNKAEATIQVQGTANPNPPINEDENGEIDIEGDASEEAAEPQAGENKVKMASTEAEALSELKLISKIDNKMSNVPSVSKEGPVRYLATDEEDAGKDVTNEASYTVEDDSIVTVSDTGLITAKKAGKTKITIEYGGNGETVNVTVSDRPVVSPPDSSIPGPVTPSTPTPVSIDKGNITDQVNDPDKNEVKVEIPGLTNSQPKVSAQVQSDTLEVLAKSSKPLVFQSGNVEVTVPNKLLKNLAGNTPDSATITIGVTKSTDINGAVSAIYEFTITAVKNGQTLVVSRFSEPVQLSVPVTNTVKDPRKVSAYYINESTKGLEYVGGKYEKNKLVFKTNHFSKFVVVENAKTFADIQKHWAKDPIEVLASRTITSGNTDTTFNPEGKVTRAEFAVLMARALILPTESYKGTFKDVKESKAWAYPGIEAAYRAGIVTGKAKDMFDPDAIITREEIATMVMRAVNYQNASLGKNVDTSTTFADDHSIGSFAKDAVKQAVGLGIIIGKPGNKFDPKASATRAEAAVLLYQALDKLGEF